MSFVLTAFALLVVAGLLLQLTSRLLVESASILDSLSTLDWVRTSQDLASAAEELDQKIVSNRASWAE